MNLEPPASITDLATMSSSFEHLVPLGTPFRSLEIVFVWHGSKFGGTSDRLVVWWPKNGIRNCGRYRDLLTRTRSLQRPISDGARSKCSTYKQPARNAILLINGLWR